MSIFPIKAFTDNYIWLLVAHDRVSCLCVDPGDAAPVIEFVEREKLILDTILLTHHHADHAGGVMDLLDYRPDIDIYGPNDARLSHIPNLICDQNYFTWHNYLFQVFFIPGHTATHICFYESSHHMLFCGDTLFSAGCGRVFDGTSQDLYQSLQQLAQLPDATQVYCGHEYTRDNLRFASTIEPQNMAIRQHYQHLMDNPKHCSLPSTIGLEKEINPFLRIDQPEILVYAQKKGIYPLDELSVFKLIREEKNAFS